MKVEYRTLPHVGGKVSTIGIGAGSLHEFRPQEIKDISFPSYHDDFLVYTVVQGRPALFWRSCIRDRDVNNAQNDVSRWLRKIGITEVKT